MAKKKLTAEAYAEELEGLHEHIKSTREVSEVLGAWKDYSGFQRWAMEKHYWDLVVEFPPLIAAAHEYGKPQGSGKYIWNAFAEDVMEKVFGNDHDRFATQLKALMEKTQSNYYSQEDYYDDNALHILAYQRFKTFVSALEALGVKQYKTSLTDHGLAASELKQVEAYLAKMEKEIGAFKNPAPKESLFEAPKKGKYATFSDTEFTAYLADIWSKYGKGLDYLKTYGLPLNSSDFERILAPLEDFDYAEICATLGAQKRFPPEDGIGSNIRTYELLAALPGHVTAAFDKTTAGEVDSSVATSLGFLKTQGMRAYALTGLRELSDALNWLVSKLPDAVNETVLDAKAKVAQAYDPLWAAMSAGPLHAPHMKEIIFTNSRTFPQSEDEIPEALNPAKEPVYAHVLLSDTWKNLMNDMMFLEFGNDRLMFKTKQISNPDSAYLCLDLFPEESVGRNPELISFVGKVLEAADGEVNVNCSPASGSSAAGTLKLKMTKADIGKLAARTEKLAAAAEANRTAEAVLPEAFTKPFKPYADAVLQFDNLVEAIEEAWSLNWVGKSIKVKHIRVNYYKGKALEWTEELGPLRAPVARLTASYVGMIYEDSDGKTYCVEDGIQFRQFHLRGKGYGKALNVLFWGVSPFALPPEQVKRIAK